MNENKGSSFDDFLREESLYGCWVSIETGKPRENVDVLVWTGKEILLCWRKKGSKYADYKDLWYIKCGCREGSCPDKVLAWHPLPVPPKENHDGMDKR